MLCLVVFTDKATGIYLITAFLLLLLFLFLFLFLHSGVDQLRNVLQRGEDYLVLLMVLAVESSSSLSSSSNSPLCTPLPRLMASVLRARGGGAVEEEEEAEGPAADFALLPLPGSGRKSWSMQALRTPGSSSGSFTSASAAAAARRRRRRRLHSSMSLSESVQKELVVFGGGGGGGGGDDGLLGDVDEDAVRRFVRLGAGDVFDGVRSGATASAAVVLVDGVAYHELVKRKRMAS
ncbi:hypothetical protein TYRP_013732 [Tyrophagus putrescentiae]|nr:hypothetical protein TYRP_013732 [Tyrophagus putrescentiae]